MCGDEVEGFEWFFVEVRGFGLDHFDGHDAEGPDVDFWSVFFLLDDFGGHPVGCADHGGALAFGFGELGAETEIGCGADVSQGTRVASPLVLGVGLTNFDMSASIQEDVVTFDIAVDDVLVMQMC